MASQKEVGLLNPNNDITYYASWPFPCPPTPKCSVYAVPPIRPRDFLMQRSWLDLGEEKLICSQSVCHEVG